MNQSRLREIVRSDDLENERFLHLKSEIKNLKLDNPKSRATALSYRSFNLRFLISDFRCRNRSFSKLSDFTIPRRRRQGREYRPMTQSQCTR
jgi:hypothetical protein